MVVKLGDTTIKIYENEKLVLELNTNDALDLARNIQYKITEKRIEELNLDHNYSKGSL